MGPHEGLEAHARSEPATPGDRALVSVLLVSGALLGTVGNALHPFLDPHLTTDEFLKEVQAATSWRALHLLITVSVVLLTAGLVLLSRRLALAGASDAGWLTGVLALMGGTLFVAVIGAVDGAAMTILAEEAGEIGRRGAVSAAAGLRALDAGLLSLVVALYLGATLSALGRALFRAGVFAPWIGVTSSITGAAGIGTGALMFLGIADEFTNYAFRGVAVGFTLVTFALGIQLRRSRALRR